MLIRRKGRKLTMAALSAHFVSFSIAIQLINRTKRGKIFPGENFPPREFSTHKISSHSIPRTLHATVLGNSVSDSIVWRENETQKNIFVARHKLFFIVFSSCAAEWRKKKFTRKTLTLFISLCLGFDSIICYFSLSFRGAPYIGEHTKQPFIFYFDFFASSVSSSIFDIEKRDASVANNTQNLSMKF